MKQILYDMCLLTLVRWLFQRAFKFEPPDQDLGRKGSPQPIIERKLKCVSKGL